MPFESRIRSFIKSQKHNVLLFLIALLIFLTTLTTVAFVHPSQVHGQIISGSKERSIERPREMTTPIQLEDDHFTYPEFEGIVVDDLSEQFSQHGPEKYWYEEVQGYNDHYWWTRNNLSGVENSARWSLPITQQGTYDLFVYIPPTHATTRHANYLIHHSGQLSRVVVDQFTHRNTWYRLGSISFNGSGEEYIELIDETGEQDGKFEIAFDAMGFLYEKPDAGDQITDQVWNRFQPWLDEQSEKIQSKIGAWLQEQKAKLLRKLGDSLKDWIDQQCAGLGAALLLPLTAFILWRRQQNKS